ncbi:MAG: alpha-E domain-containing protein, partial [Chthoniobacterales bacterium]
MLSRVAESCFWMSRYIERAETSARLLDVNMQLLLDFENQDRGLTGVDTRHWIP